jgi:hypothetical protein
MKKASVGTLATTLVSIAALLLAALALFQARKATECALSEVAVEERETLITPVFDQESGRWSCLAIYEVTVSNLGGPDLVLTGVSPAQEGSGFLVLLDGERVVEESIPHAYFEVKPGLDEIRADPRLLKDLFIESGGEGIEVDISLSPGESKNVRFGLSLSPYDDSRSLRAKFALVSFWLHFSTGKKIIFRRGFAIPPLKQE